MLLQTTMNTGGVRPLACASAFCSHSSVILLVVAVKAWSAPCSPPGSFGSPPISSRLSAFLGQMLADAQPEIAVGRLLAGHRIVGDRTRGTFTMPASMASISEKSDTTHGNSVPSG